MSNGIVERWARRLVEEELEQTVELNDDQSAPSMYDLRVGPKLAPVLAVECVGAVDEVRVETWNVGPAKGPWFLPLEGDWTVCLLRTARITELRHRLGGILRLCEELGIGASLHVDWILKRTHPDLFAEFEDLGIDWAGCYRRQGQGKVSFTMEGIGGWVDTEGTTLLGWITEFLEAPDRADVLSKLASSGAPERHAFVVVDFGGATFSVESYLAGQLLVLPTDPPRLPPPVTGIWITSTSGGVGLRWTGTIWKRFGAVWHGREAEGATAA